MLVGSTEFGLEGNVDKTKYMFMSHEQNSEHNHILKVSLNLRKNSDILNEAERSKTHSQ